MGLFGKKGKVQVDLGGAFAGFMAGFGAPGGAQMLNAHHQRKQSALDAAREDAQWKAREQWKRDNPAPINNDTVADYNFWKSKLSPQQFEEYVQSKISPPQYMNVPGVGLVQVPRQGPSATPKPLSDAEFDALPDAPGTQGGPQANPLSGGFPRIAPIRRSNGGVYNRY